MLYIKSITVRIIPLLILSFSLASCATIFKGSTAEVRVNSAPAGANVYFNGIDRGTTPQTLNLRRDSDYVLEFRRDGFQDVRVEVNKKFDGATTILGNIFSWALLGIVVDLATGSAYSLTPADVQANLPEMQAQGLVPEDYQPAENEIFVIMLSEEEWKQIQNK